MSISTGSLHTLLFVTVGAALAAAVPVNDTHHTLTTRGVQWGQYPGVDLTATTELGRMEGTSADGCKTACMNDNFCNAAVHGTDDLCTLRLFTANTKMVDFPWTNTYIKSTTRGPSPAFGDPWACYKGLDLTATEVLATINLGLSVENCKAACNGNSRCNAVIYAKDYSRCTLRATSADTQLVESAHVDAYAKDLPYIYVDTRPSGTTRMAQGLPPPPADQSEISPGSVTNGDDVIVLYSVQSELTAGGRKLGRSSRQVGAWGPWGGCTGTCGSQTRSRRCGGGVCRGPSTQACVVKSQCCIFTKDSPSATSILVPLYLGPTVSGDACSNPGWAALAKGCRGVTAVINVDNGPGHNVDAYGRMVFQTCMRSLGNHGVRTMGYIHTKTSHYDQASGIFSYTGFRDKAQTQRDVTMWVRQWGQVPGFSGIFVDEVSNPFQVIQHQWGADHVQYYKDLINHIKTVNPNLEVILNSAGAPPAALFRPSAGFPRPADTSVFFEETSSKFMGPCYANSQGSYGPGPYCSTALVNNPPDDIFVVKSLVERNMVKGAAMVHGMDATTALQGLDIARRSRLAYYYASAVTLPGNPWGQLPPYLNDLLRKMNTM